MDSLFYYSNNCIIVILMIACLCIRRKYFLFSWSTDVTSTDLVSAKGKTKEVYSCDSCFDRSILMFLMREGLQCRINISKHCLMRLWNDINQLTFVFTFAETRSLKRMWSVDRKNKYNYAAYVLQLIHVGGNWNLCVGAGVGRSAGEPDGVCGA